MSNNICDWYYTGIGSRSTPLNIRDLMTTIARRLALLNFRLRSGGAKGADQAFEDGAWPISDIYVPVPFFERDRLGYISLNSMDPEIVGQAHTIAKSVHPAWDRCSQFAKAAHIRNVFQVLGDELNKPSEFVICWAQWRNKPKTIVMGGTNTAVQIAVLRRIPVFNLIDGMPVMHELGNLINSKYKP